MRHLVFFASVVLALLLVSCGNDHARPASGPACSITSLSVTPENVTLAVGDSLAFKVVGWCENGDVLGSITEHDGMPVLWSSDNSGVASVDAHGVATGVGPGSVAIHAWMGLTFASAHVTVTPERSLQALAVQPATAEVQAGSTRQFVAAATYSDGTTEDASDDASWLVDDATVATVSPQGVATGLAAGNTMVRVVLGGFTSTATLAVTSEKTLEALLIEPSAANVMVGSSKQFLAVARYSDGTDEDAADATWTVDDSSVATVSAKGLATGVSVGETSLRATFEGETATASLRVIDDEVIGLEVIPVEASIGVGETFAFAAVAEMESGSTVDATGSVAWSSSFAAVATISPGGVATGLAAGSTEISAVWEGKTAKASLTVMPPYVTGVHVTPPAASLAVGGSLASFVATATLSDGTSQDVTQSSTWSSSNEHMATVIGQGVVQSHDCVGTATISASYVGVTGTASLAVGSGPTLIALVIEPAHFELPVGMSQTIEASGTFSDGTIVDLTDLVTWVSDDPSIADLEQWSSLYVAAVATGKTAITASMCGVSSSPAVVTVGPPVLSGLQVTPWYTEVSGGCVDYLHARGIYSDGSEADVGHLATWASSAPKIVEVLNQPAPGMIVPSSGSWSQATITATIDTAFGPASSSAEVRVSSSSFRSLSPSSKTLFPAGFRTLPLLLQIEPTDAWTPVLGTVQFGGGVWFSDGNWADVSSVMTWSMIDPAVATVSAFGLATGIAPGTSAIQGQWVGMTGSTTLTVGGGAPTSITVVCDAWQVQPGFGPNCSIRGRWDSGYAAGLGPVGTWSSSDPSVVSVNGSTLTAVAPGTAVLSASYAGHSDSAEIEVLDAQLVSVEVSPAFATIPVLQRQEFQAVGIFSQGPPRRLPASWSTTLEQQGNWVTGSRVGTTTVSCTIQGVKSNDAIVEVLPIKQTGVTVIPDRARTFPHGRAVFAAVESYEGGLLATVTPRSWWHAGPAGIAVESLVRPGPGWVTGLDVGTAQVSARFCQSEGFAELVIPDAQLASISVVPSAVTLHLGTRRRLRAFGVFTDGSAGVEVTDQVGWGTEDASVVAVHDDGAVFARGAGASTVVATFGRTGAQGTAHVVIDGASVLETIHVWFVGPGHQGDLPNPSVALAHVPLGGRLQAKAMGVFRDGTDLSYQDITDVVVWSSSAVDLARVSNAPGEQGLVAASILPGQTGSVAIRARYDGATGPVVSNAAAAVVTACSSYASYEICALDSNDRCMPVSNAPGTELVVSHGVPLSLGVFAVFDETAPGCQGLGQRGYHAIRDSIWSPSNGTVALVGNQGRAGEVTATGAAGALTTVLARWRGGPLGMSDVVTVRVGP